MKYTEEEIKTIISQLVYSKPHNYTVILKKSYIEIYDFLRTKYPQLIDHSISECCYWFLNDLDDFPKCKNKACNKKLTKFRNIKCGYLNYCSIKCSAISDYTREKFKKTNIKKYGVEHPCKSDKTIAKIKQTNLEKYGVECVLQNEDIKNKVKKTILEKYGTEYAIQNTEIYEKLKKTNLERYGVECTLQNEDVKNKSKQTCLKKYNVDNPTKNEEIRNKIKQTNLEKYGVECVLQAEEIKNKIKTTNLERYGVENILQAEEIRNKIKQTNLEKYGVENAGGASETLKKIQDSTLKHHNVKYGFLKENSHEKSRITRLEHIYLKNIKTEFEEPLFDKDFFVNNYSADILLKFRCKKCGNEFDSYHYNGYHKHCPICYPKCISGPEREILTFLETLNIVLKTNDRNQIKPLELDIYIPEKKLAIEFDGLYWHSDPFGKNKNYHLNKTLDCEKQGIQLIHIFENEWLTKQDIVKSRLKNLLGIYDKTVYARKCEIKEVDSKTSKEFQEENHIQGAVNSKVNLGLYFEDELIGLMTFGKCRFDKKHEWELLRFCNRLGYHIPGGASRLLKYFERNYQPKSLVSYADRRWSKGKVYEKLGFTFNHASVPNYWYWKKCMLYSRIKFQKHKLKNLLEKFDENKTEVENMLNNGYNRIFDCGNLVFEKNYL